MGYFKYLFTTTKGLILLNVVLISVVVAVFGTLSGPMKEWGIAAVTKSMLGMEMHPEDREGRIIMLYHTIAMGFLSLLVYIITDIVKMSAEKARGIRNTITVGYIMALVFGLGFAYWGRNWAFHGLFLVGQALADSKVVFGAFPLAIHPSSPALELVAFVANLRSRFLKLPYGDQAVFVRREAYFQLDIF